MDATATDFRTAEAECKWDHFIEIVNETEKQKGQIYLRHNGSDTEVLADVTWPAPRKVLFKSGKVSVYEPKIAQVTEFEGVPRDAALTYLMIGFGGRGHDLLKSHKVSLAGWETVDGVRTAKLQLTPLSPEFGSTLREFFIWIDPQRDVPLQQQISETFGDKWVQHCTGFQINGTIPEDVFGFKTRPGTEVIKRQMK